MNIDQWIKLLDVILPFVQTLIWLALILYIVIFPARSLIAELPKLLRDPKLKAFDAELKDFKISIQREIQESVTVASSITLASARSSQPVNAQEVTDLVSRAVSNFKEIRGARILWVDDEPDYQEYERNVLETLGMKIDRSSSTEDALDKIHANKDGYDVIISDMERGNEHHAGYDLLDELQREGMKTPFIIYAGLSSVLYEEETKKRGGFGNTNSPQKLFDLVINALQQR